MEICPTCHRPMPSGKPKSSPENRLFHALVSQLAMHHETTLELCKRYVKIRACGHGYPYEALKEADRTIVEPKSVADASTTEVALLIEMCYKIAAEWNCKLRGE